MSVLAAIQKDIESLRITIWDLHKKLQFDVKSGFKNNSVFWRSISKCCTQLREKELLIQSGVIPSVYLSLSTNNYHRSSSEPKQQVLNSLPVAKHTFFAFKNKRSNHSNHESHFSIYRDDNPNESQIEFSIEHKPDKHYPTGTFAQKVKKAIQGNKTYAVKVYKDCNDEHYLAQLAMRAAHCYRQLGRTGYAFRHNHKQYLVTDWMPGTSFQKVTQESVLSISIQKRVEMAIALLKELNILHQQGLIHNDIKPGNVIINIESCRLNFIDLDSVRYTNERLPEKQCPIHTNLFLPTRKMLYGINRHLKFNEHSDIYAMGLTLIHLFPEIYNPKISISESGHCFFKFKRGTERIHDPEKYPELTGILKNMCRYQTPSTPKSVSECIEAFQNISQTCAPEDKNTHSLKRNQGKTAFDAIDIELIQYPLRKQAFDRDCTHMLSTELSS